MKTRFLKRFLAFALLLVPGYSWGQAYSFEAETAILSNGAAVQSASACSGGSQVVNIGGTQNGSVSKIFTLTQGGDYDLTLSYCSADSRSVFVWVNYGDKIEIKCPSSADWSTPADIKIQINLAEGQNTLIFDNKSDWGPNLDKVSLSPSPVYDISGKVETDGVGTEGVLVSLGGAREGETTTDINGNYSFTGLTSGKNYTITPAKSGVIFSPPYQSFEPLSSEESEVNFQVYNSCTECIKKLTFGSSGEIDYNTQTGIYSVLYGENEVVKNAQCIARNGNTDISSLDYATREVTVEDITDNFGTGQKMTVVLSGDDLPEMQQVFYAYDDCNYFLTEVSLSGSDLESNFMAPLVTNQVTIPSVGDNRFLSVPFDNDGFVRYQSDSFSSYAEASSSEVTAFYDNDSRNGFIVGSVEHTTWKTGIKGAGKDNGLSSLTAFGGYTDASVTRDRKEHGAITGSQIKSPMLFVGYFDDWRDGMEEYGKANAIAEPRYIFSWEDPTPFGWNSWGSIQTDINLTKAKAVVDFFAQEIPDFRNGETAYIDLDSYWDNMVTGGWEGDFSQLTTFANYCKSKGLKPGIYWAPFVDWGKYDRTVEGSDYRYAATWTKVNGGYHDEDGGRAMDPTHPATKQRIKYLIDKFIDCGFEMIKIDFLGHAAIEADSFYDPEVKTGMQAYREGMEYLTDQLQGKMFVYAAISPNLATGRYAHSRRIACDAYGDIGSTEYTLNSNTYGWWQSKIYNYVDGDMLLLGDNSLGENHARLTSGVINGTLITADDFSTTGQWTDRAKTLFQNKDILDVARDGVAFRPVEGNSTSSASEIFVKTEGDDYYVAVVNYGDAKTFNLDFERLGLESVHYLVTELFSGQKYSADGTSFSIDIPARDAVILRFSDDSNPVNDVDMNSELKVFPNPAHDKVYVENNGNISTIQLINLNGQILESFPNIAGNRFEFDISGCTNGIYFIKINRDKGDNQIIKLVKI